jgi:hypothetical protein
MVTVLSQHGLRIVIYLDDHVPAHVHVYGDGHAKIDLKGPGERPVVVWASSMKRSDVRRALKLVSDHQVLLLETWRRIHG